MRLLRWIENRLDFLAKESVYGRGVDTGVFIGRQHRELEIIKLLEDNCECMFEINEYYSGCHNHRIIALIRGEK